MTKSNGLKLLVCGAALLVAAPLAQASDYYGRRSRGWHHTVVRERVIAPGPVATRVVRPIGPPLIIHERPVFVRPAPVIVHHPPARVVSYQTHIVEAPRVIAPPPVRTEVVVQSDGWYEPVDPIDVDIESLKAELRFDHREGQWWLKVRYDVETKYAANGQFDLVVELHERGAPLLDKRGEPLHFAVVLDRPTDVDDEELEYEDRFETPLPSGLAFHPDKLKAHAVVVDRQTNDVLDVKRESVDFDD